VLQNPKTQNIVGILNDNTDPMLNAMKVETAPKVSFIKKSVLKNYRNPTQTLVVWSHRSKS
jgi:ATP-dependent 26S proteasome regulatory subunit